MAKTEPKTVFPCPSQELNIQISFVEKWPLANPNELVFILATYLMFVFKVGPYFMSGRNPFQIKPFLIAFNALKVLNSIYLGFKFFSYILDKGIFPRNCDHDDGTIHAIAVLYWKYMATKVLDLFDTVIFVLKKNYRQLSFLHLYHHIFMVISSWTCLKYDPSDHWAFVGCMNCTVHAMMYTYYGISALGPKYAKYLWWKRYLTLVQMIQFILGISHIVIQTSTSQCPMKTSTFIINTLNLMLFIALFYDFYRNNYNQKDPKIMLCGNHDE